MVSAGDHVIFASDALGRTGRAERAPHEFTLAYWLIAIVLNQTKMAITGNPRR
jgi:hypothetical protein